MAEKIAPKKRKRITRDRIVAMRLSDQEFARLAGLVPKRQRAPILRRGLELALAELAGMQR